MNLQRFRDGPSGLKNVDFDFKTNPFKMKNDDKVYDDKVYYDEVIRSNKAHKNLAFPQCYGFCPTDSQLLRLFLRNLCEGSSLGPSPIHPIDDIYAIHPESLSRSYPPGNGRQEWFFFARKTYKDPLAKVVRKTNYGNWIKRISSKRIPLPNGNVLGYKRTQEFQAKGAESSGTVWFMEEFSSRDQKDYIVCKLFKEDGSNPITQTLHTPAQQMHLNSDALPNFNEDGSKPIMQPLHTPGQQMNYFPDALANFNEDGSNPITQTLHTPAQQMHLNSDALPNFNEDGSKPIMQPLHTPGNR